MHRLISIAVLAFPALALAAAPAAKTPSVLNHNLVANAGCESANDEGFPGSWKGTIRCETYGHTSGEWDWGMTGTPEGGKRYFRVQFADDYTAASAGQSADLGAAAADIDSGKLHYDLSGWLGSYPEGKLPGLTLRVVFYDGSNKELGRNETSLELGGVAKPAVGEAAMKQQTVSGTVPPHARRAEVTLDAKLPSGLAPEDAAPALADDLSLVLTSGK